MRKKIQIDQTLHGYSNGHHLIGSSINLSKKSKRLMEVLSDLSGSEVVEGFNDYFTGYFLVEENKAILSRTWYANEMERPGCVWTHSLLIDILELRILGNDIDNLLKLFCRPQCNDFAKYEERISYSIDIGIKDVDPIMMKYIIWALWGNKQPVIIPSLDSKSYLETILYFWIRENTDLKFTFSTGSLSIRKFEDKYFDLQIMPNKLSYKVKNNKNVKLLKDINDIVSFPVWVSKSQELYVKDNWMDFNLFREKFGYEYLNRKYLAHFIKIYIGCYADANDLDIVEGLKIIDKILFTERKEIGARFLDLYFNNKLADWTKKYYATKLLFYIVENHWLVVNNNQIGEIVIRSFNEEFSTTKRLFKYLANNNTNKLNEEILVTYINSMSITELENFSDMDLNICCIMIANRPEFLTNKCIWEQKLEFQQQVLLCLKERNLFIDMSSNIVRSVLDSSIYDLATNLFEIFNKSCISIFIEYVLGFRVLASKKYDTMKKICRKNAQECIMFLESRYTDLNISQLINLIAIIDSYSYCILNLDRKFVVSLFDSLKVNELSYKQKMIIARFFFPVILRSTQKFPKRIVEFAFQMIHSSIAQQTFPDEEWIRLEKYLPYNKWYSQWDKCKRVRKAVKQRGYEINIQEKDDLDIHLL